MTNVMGAMGRGGDALMAHVTPGDVVIPRDVALSNPEFLTKFQKAMEQQGGDYRTHVVGSGYESFNPETGAPEFFFRGLRRFFRNPGKQIKRFVKNPGREIGRSIKTGTNPFKIAGLDRAIASVVDPIFGTGPKPKAPTPVEMPEPDLGGLEEEFVPERPGALEQPAGLAKRDVGGQEFGTLDPLQQRSYIATQGAFGGGIGQPTQDWYLNQLQRNLMSESGAFRDIEQETLPIERTYLSQLGLPTSGTTEFFRALQA